MRQADYPNVGQFPRRFYAERERVCLSVCVCVCVCARARAPFKEGRCTLTPTLAPSFAGTISKPFARPGRDSTTGGGSGNAGGGSFPCTCMHTWMQVSSQPPKTDGRHLPQYDDCHGFRWNPHEAQKAQCRQWSQNRHDGSPGWKPFPCLCEAASQMAKDDA